jgi:hypothetical protein
VATGTGVVPVATRQAASKASIELFWLPLGAGGWFVRLNGRIYEALHALLERRACWRVFRYEVRRWRDGVIADADEAVASPGS